MSQTMQKSGEVMKSMNKLMNMPQMQATMQMMSQEMAKAGLIEEVMGDDIDMAMDEGDGEETKASSAADNASIPTSPPAVSHLVEFADYTSKQAAAAGMGNSNAGANTPPTGSAKVGNIRTGLTAKTPYSHDHDEEEEDDDDELGGLIGDDLLRGAVEMQSPSAVDEPLSPFPNLVTASRSLPGTRVASQALPTKTKKKKNSIARSNTTPASHLESGQLKETAMWDSEVNALKSSHEFQEVKASLQADHSRVVRNKEGAAGGERRAERGSPHIIITYRKNRSENGAV